MVWATFVMGKHANQAAAVRVLGQIDAPGASQALAMLAVFGGSADVRRIATETLRRRDLREFADLLVGLVRDPIKYEVKPVGGPGSPGELFAEVGYTPTSVDAGAQTAAAAQQQGAAAAEPPGDRPPAG